MGGQSQALMTLKGCKGCGASTEIEEAKIRRPGAPAKGGPSERQFHRAASHAPARLHNREVEALGSKCAISITDLMMMQSRGDEVE